MPVGLILFLQVLYAVGAVGLAIYGAHALWLTWKLLRHRRPSPQPISPSSANWPRVTVQLPIYNERHVIERLIDACANLDYPRDRLQIQVLDDSDDQTTAIAQRRVLHWQQVGVDAQMVRRANRSGYKAGALAHALPLASGDFIAIFDADFLPPADFLQRTLPHFFEAAERQIGFVQARWDHLNRNYSLLTASQALALDGHFGVEQPARAAAGYPFGFNGSAGVWRRACIEDERVGGWQIDTLCEDLDLAYRAQLAGWRGCFLADVAAPAEIPPQLLAFKRQQFRWAKGSVQTLRKQAGHVLRADWPLPARIAGLLHLGNYLIHPLLLLLLLTALPLLLADAPPPTLFAALSLASLGPPLLYAVAQRRLHPQRWLRHWLVLPVLMLLGMGVCLNNTIAIAQGLRGQNGKSGQFLRTPKFRIETGQDDWRQSAYRLPVEPRMIVEGMLALYAVAAAITAGEQANWLTALFMLLYAASFGLMVGADLWQTWRARNRTVGSFGRAAHYREDPSSYTEM
jgi:cellulose synthase/poly-beta-1,6-N-acetylglucosamine synthase-like glycosyltransferase